MSKLQSEHYKEIVLQAIDLPSIDFESHYQTFICSNIQDNPDIIDRIIHALNDCISWWRGHFTDTYFFEIDEHGNNKISNPFETLIPTYTLTGRMGKNRKHVDKKFFDDQINLIKSYGETINLIADVLKSEKSLPDSIQDKLSHLVVPGILDLNGMKKRVNTAENLFNEYISTLSDSLLRSNDYIKPEKINELNVIEERASVLIKNWTNKTSGYKINCAAFVDLLMENGFFKKEYTINKRDNCKRFAELRYLIPIGVQMNTSEDTSRKTHKTKMGKYFNPL